MIESPPVESPSDQLKPICAALVIDGLFVKALGASGIKTMKAPLPIFETGEFP